MNEGVFPTLLELLAGWYERVSHFGGGLLGYLVLFFHLWSFRVLVRGCIV